MEVTVIKVSELTGKKLETFVQVNFPYPSKDVQTFQTPTIKGSNPEFNSKQSLRITRKKTFFTFCKRKKITFMLFQKGSWFSGDQLVGKIELVPSDFFTKCEIQQSFDLLNEKRKSIGSKLEVNLKIRTPLNGPQIKKITKSKLIIDEYLQALGLTNKPQQKQKQQQQQQPQKKQQQQQQQQNKTKTETIQTKVEKIDLKPNEGNPDNIDPIISFDILAQTIKDCDETIKKFRIENKEIPQNVLKKKKSTL
ncbi:coiled-coil and c2 domain-containing protein 1-like [Anaeramoeba flamelloides]|uniref:Coiled-coil and c2 domain-containing protein 1-like n=1 Tax=Anaeramoeba flamelloides TaxID=1746091 RepID=A0ABQ8XW01_9EUKA|nr:coiled-coil and c2 domain-containing protein 1-like [Anaeramoeba flamelloides]